jgi:hypothetical protein
MMSTFDYHNHHISGLKNPPFKNLSLRRSQSRHRNNELSGFAMRREEPR